MAQMNCPNLCSLLYYDGSEGIHQLEGEGMTGEREKRSAALRISKLGLPSFFRRRRTIDPLTAWPDCAGLVEAFIDMLGEDAGDSPCDEALAAVVSGLLAGTGCAIVRDRMGQAEMAAVTGTWESEDLESILDVAGLEWIFALDQDPMILVQQTGALRLRRLRGSGRASGTGVAFPASCGNRPVGAVLVTYDGRRTLGGTFLPAAKLLSGAVGLQMTIDELGTRSRGQGERIGRLTSEVERMGILLQRTGLAGGGPEVPV